jgi:hypothetical protein
MTTNEREPMPNSEEIKSISTEVTIRKSDFCGTYCFSIPQSVWTALGLPANVDKSKEHQKPIRMYVVLRDILGNLIHQRLVKIGSGHEVLATYFSDQLTANQLYPGQRICLEVSRADDDVRLFEELK